MGQKGVPLDISVSNLGSDVSKLNVGCLILEVKFSNLETLLSKIDHSYPNFRQKDPTDNLKVPSPDVSNSIFKLF